jgi:phage terminase small subunit
MPLTDKQARFVKEYALDHNGSEAAIRAGYAPKTARSTASRLLTKDNIRQALAVREQSTAEQLDLTHQFVLKGLMDIAREGKTESARVRAYELLGKHQGMFIDRVELTQIPDRELVHEWTEALIADVNTRNG